MLKILNFTNWQDIVRGVSVILKGDCPSPAISAVRFGADWVPSSVVIVEETANCGSGCVVSDCGSCWAPSYL